MLLEVTVYATLLLPGVLIKVIHVKETTPFVTVSSVLPTFAQILEATRAIVSTEAESVAIICP